MLARIKSAAPSYDAGLQAAFPANASRTWAGSTNGEGLGQAPSVSTAALVRAPDPDTARGTLTPDRYVGLEVHNWQFGGRS